MLKVTASDGMLTGMSDGPPHAQETLSLSDEVLADLLASGEYMVDACATLGLCKRTVYRRLKREPAFAEAMNEASLIGYEVKQARLDQVARGVAGISTGDAKRDALVCKQGAWALEKLHPGQYGQKVEVKNTGVQANYTLSDDPNEAAKQYADLIGER